MYFDFAPDQTLQSFDFIKCKQLKIADFLKTLFRRTSLTDKLKNILFFGLVHTRKREKGALRVWRDSKDPLLPPQINNGFPIQFSLILAGKAIHQSSRKKAGGGPFLV